MSTRPSHRPSSRTKITSLRLLPILAVAVALAGCSEDGPVSPAAQPATTTYQAMQATTTITSLECIADGDGVEGAGEFAITAKVPWTNKSWNRTLSSGQSATLNWTTKAGLGTYPADALEPRDYEDAFVGFICTEWDTDILGRDFADSDMDGRRATATHAPVAGQEIVNYITLGNDKCKARLHYRIKFELIEFEG